MAITDLLRGHDGVNVARSTDTALLRVSGARVAYGSSVVVHDVSLSIAPGEVACVLGRNGAGKTTLLKAIMGCMPFRSGSVQFNGWDMTRAESYRRARAGIGYVPQGRGIFPYLTVLENLIIGMEPAGKDTGQLDWVFTLFPVLQQMRGRTAGVLSGGQQQQLALGRALMGRPSLLLLDEPTEGIQPNIVEEIERVIASLRGQVTILLVEQFLDFALASADRCYVMESGSIVMEGSPKELDAGGLQEYLAM